MTRPRMIPSLVALLLAAVLAACGGEPPTVEEAAPAEGDAGAAADASPGTGAEAGEDPYQGVYAELEGMSGEERRARLVELAQAEDATLSVYASNTDMPELATIFSDEFGIPVEVYRARPPDVLRRVLQEQEAGDVQADLLDSNGYEMGVMASEGLTADYEGPVQEQLREGTDWEGWTANRFTLTSPVWNTQVITDPPEEFADMADPRFAGQLLVETNAFDWYMTLSSWFQEQGMTEEEFEEMFTAVVRNATVLEGNTNHIQFLASGEYGISAGTFHHLADDAIADGAPLSRLPAVQPTIARPNGMGLSAETQYPASTILLFEWLLTDAQPSLVEEYRLPALAGIESNLLEGVDELITIDVNRLVAEGAEWQERYERLLMQAAGTAEAPAG